MIEQALMFVAGDLNAHLRRQFQQDRDLLFVAPLVGNDGVPISESANAVVLSISNISQESVVRNQPRTQNAASHALQFRRPLELNIHLVFAAGLKRYDAGLALLSAIIARLHDSCVFDRQNASALPQGILRLAFHMLTLDYSQQSHLWGGLGAKYVPSVLYEMRMITDGPGQLAGVGTSVSGLGNVGRTSSGT